MTSVIVFIKSIIPDIETINNLIYVILVDEKYAKEEVGADNIGIAGGAKPTGATVTITKKDIAELAEVDEANIQNGAEVENGKITKFVYKKSGKTCTYTKGAKDGTDGAYDVAK